MLRVSFYVPPSPSLLFTMSEFTLSWTQTVLWRHSSTAFFGERRREGGAENLITCVCYLEQIFPAWRTRKKESSTGFSSQAEWKYTTSSLQSTVDPEQACTPLWLKTFCYGHKWRMSWLLMSEGSVPFLVWPTVRGYYISFCSLNMSFPMIRLILIIRTSNHAEAWEHGKWGFFFSPRCSLMGHSLSSEHLLQMSLGKIIHWIDLLDIFQNNLATKRNY